MEHLKQSFAPLIGTEVNVLILGSIPGDRSIEMGEYYGHPRNRFWPVMAVVCKEELPTDYESKRRMLTDHRIGLWDVAHQAVRKGSLDSAIRNEIPNDIMGLIEQHPELHTIVFNGKKAEKLYNKYFKRIENIHYWALPSTSPANAGCRLEELFQKWEEQILPSNSH